jgi:hypothetical protein
MDKSAVYFGLFLTALRNEGVIAPMLDYGDDDVAELIACALDIIDPDDDTAAETAEQLALVLHSMAGDELRYDDKEDA